MKTLIKEISSHKDFILYKILEINANNNADMIKYKQQQQVVTPKCRKINKR